MDHHLFCGNFFSGCPDCLLPHAGSPLRCKTGINIQNNVHRQHVHGDRHRNSLDIEQTISIEKNGNPTAVGNLFSCHHRGCRDEPVPGSADRPCCGASGHVPESKEDDCFFLLVLILIVSLPNVTHRIAQRGFNDPG